MFSRRMLSLFVAALMSTAMDCESDPVTPTLSAVTLASTTSSAAHRSQGTVRISSAAPATGFTVALSSNNAVATVVPAP